METLDFPTQFDESFVNDINERIMIKEVEYLNQKRYQNTSLVDSLVRLIKKDQIINDLYSNQLEILHQCSLNEGGFINCENRKIIYKYIINLLYKPKNQGADEFVQVSNEMNTEYKTRDIIIKDCDRSVLYSLLNEYYKDSPDAKQNEDFCIVNKNEEGSAKIENDSSKKEISKEDCKKYLYNLRYFVRQSLGENIDYEYYQGYQDLALYFMILFGKEGIDLLYKFNKIFLDEYLKETKMKTKNFDDYLTTLTDCLKLIDNNVNEDIFKITKTKPYYSLSWLITWFSHKNDSLFNQFRLMDYFITSSFTEIYFYSGEVIISEYNKFVKGIKESTPQEDLEDMELMGNLFIHFQELKISGINADELILKTEQDKNNHKVTENIEMVHEKKDNKEPLFNIGSLLLLLSLLISLFYMDFTRQVC